MSKNTQKNPMQVKQAEQITSMKSEVSEAQTTTPLDQAIEQDRRMNTTIRVSSENRARLDILQKAMNATDLNNVITRLINAADEQNHPAGEVHLVMPETRFRWLLVHQDKDDCRNALNDARRI
jgi:light-regulated signal transduction histidine kinase (bacteriophytochrome)